MEMKLLLLGDVRSGYGLPNSMDKGAQARGMLRVVSTHMPTVLGVFEPIGFEREDKAKRERETALVIALGGLHDGVPLLRIHSQCLTGELLGSLRCDCRGQLEVAMSALADEGSGLVTYEYQEGRGIGLMAKLKSLRITRQRARYDRSERSSGFWRRLS
jgi:GTP cyclohydrolase II